ncbi:MAG: PrgI family protein [Candidatus Gracilibacteria bacterium]
MQFKVPQDVQREDTIIGPITLKQLGILGLGGGLAYAIYVSLAKTYFMEIWLPPVAIVGGLTLAIAFLKIHNLSFGYYLMYLVEFTLLPKKRVWTQGTGIPFISPFEIVKQKQTTVSQSNELGKPKKSLNELVDIVDSYGKNAEKELSEKMKNLPTKQ